MSTGRDVILHDNQRQRFFHNHRENSFIELIKTENDFPKFVRGGACCLICPRLEHLSDTEAVSRTLERRTEKEEAPDANNNQNGQQIRSQWLKNR